MPSIDNPSSSIDAPQIVSESSPVSPFSGRPFSPTFHPALAVPSAAAHVTSLSGERLPPGFNASAGDSRVTSLSGTPLPPGKR